MIIDFFHRNFIQKNTLTCSETFSDVYLYSTLRNMLQLSKPDVKFILALKS